MEKDARFKKWLKVIPVMPQILYLRLKDFYENPLL